MTTVTHEQTRFGELLREHRERAGLSQRQLAVKLAEAEPMTEAWWLEVEKLSRSIRRWEKDTIPRGDTMLKLAAALDLAAADFDHEEEE